MIPFYLPKNKTLDSARGFTLIEVMVGLALASLSMLVVLEIFSNSEARKRSTTGAAEAQQTANVTIYQLGRALRLSGAGLTQSNNLWGCPIQAYRSATQFLPAPAAFPAPFASASVPTTVRLMPLLIVPGAAPNGISDIVVTMSGNSEMGQAELPMVGDPTAAGLSVRRSIGVKAKDLILMSNVSSISNCQIAQVDTTYTSSVPNAIPLGSTGTNYNTAGGLAGTIYDLNSVALDLGNTPLFSMFGIDANNSLQQYDLLNLTGNPSTVIAENVFDMRARYGVVDASGNGPITWQSPSASGWANTDLLAGTSAALALIDRIRAVRISIVFRTTETVAGASPPSSYVMFPDASPITVSIPSAAQNYRYQVYDSVIPLRNLRFVPSRI